MTLNFGGYLVWLKVAFRADLMEVCAIRVLPSLLFGVLLSWHYDIPLDRKSIDKPLAIVVLEVFMFALFYVCSVLSVNFLLCSS